MFDLGDPVPLSVEIRDENGTLANAGNVAVTIGRPDGTAVVLDTVPPTETGRYVYTYTPTLPGRHTVRWASTGLNAAAFTDIFDVRAVDPPYIVSLADARKAVGMTATVNDEDLREYTEAATAAVEDVRGEIVARRTVVEEVVLPRATSIVSLQHTPVISLTAVSTTDELITWSLLDLRVDGDGIVYVVSGPPLRGHVRFTTIAGYMDIPANFTRATKIIIKHLWQTEQQPSLGPRPFQAEEDFGMVQTSLGFAIPNRAAQLLGGGRGPLVA